MRGRKLWDLSFFGGSTVAALCQGLTLGGLLQGIHVVDRQYAGGWFDWLTPFTVLCGIAVVIGYAWLGACWLVLPRLGLPAVLPPAILFAGLIGVLAISTVKRAGDRP